jgi:hypothetical protein
VTTTLAEEKRRSRVETGRNRTVRETRRSLASVVFREKRPDGVPRERGASQVVNRAGPKVPLATGGVAAGDEVNVLTES